MSHAAVAARGAISSLAVLLLTSKCDSYSSAEHTCIIKFLPKEYVHIFVGLHFLSRTASFIMLSVLDCTMYTSNWCCIPGITHALYVVSCEYSYQDIKKKTIILPQQFRA